MVLCYKLPLVHLIVLGPRRASVDFGGRHPTTLHVREDDGNPVTNKGQRTITAPLHQGDLEYLLSGDCISSVPERRPGEGSLL